MSASIPVLDRSQEQLSTLQYNMLSRWPQTSLEAQARYSGPYTTENIATLLAHEPYVLYNGWPVLQERNGRTYTNGHSHPTHWPQNILEAYARNRGPYTAVNAETILDLELIELFNGWLVWKAMTNYTERRALANLQDMLSLSARKAGFGQAMPDNMECLLSNGDVVKPDASLVSWQRANDRVLPHGPKDRPLLRGGPELAIESRSPSNTRAEDRRKRALYFANDVQVVWDVDEEEEVVWVYHAATPNDPIYFSADDEIDCQPFLPNWRRRVADIFAEELSAEVAAGEVADAWRAEGHAEGVAEGMAQTLRDLLPLLVQARFNTKPPANLVSRLDRCDLPRLQMLQAAVESSLTLDEWLHKLPDTA